jgi:predicted dehydrogenase
MKGALIGCGFFAQNQLHAWCDIGGVEIVAICDNNLARLKATSAAFGILRTYEDAAEMFAELDFDFVDIATTVCSHRALVEMAANAGVDIICQKPFAKNMIDARAMVEAVQIAGKTLMVHENFRWQSPVQAALEVVKSGAIGEPFFGRLSFRSGYDIFTGQPYLAKGSRFIIEDLGIHILDISRAFFGDATHIVATTQRINQSIKGEDVATMMLTHESGATSVVDCSYATTRIPETFPQPLLEIDGTQGTPLILPWAQLPWHNIQESVLIIQQHFVECITAGIQPKTSGADNLKTLALVEAAYLSAAQGTIVPLLDI